MGGDHHRSTRTSLCPPIRSPGSLDFTELVATAIANAESREAQRLADEQAALRRVATLVARDAPPGEVFDAVAMEVAKLLDTDITVVGRYDDDGAATAIGSWSASPGGVPVGTRSVLGGHNVLTIVAETESRRGSTGTMTPRGRPQTSRAAMAGVVDRRPDHRRGAPVGCHARRHAKGGAVSGRRRRASGRVHRSGRDRGRECAGARRGAALRRRAGCARAGRDPRRRRVRPEKVFTAVVEEVSSLLGLERIELVRYEGDTTGSVIAASGEHPFPAGSTWSLDDPSVMATVARTRRAARIDDYSDLDGEIAARHGRRLPIGDRRTDHRRRPPVGHDHRDLDRSGADSGTVEGTSRPVHRACRDRSRKRRGATRARARRSRAGRAAAGRDAGRQGSARGPSPPLPSEVGPPVAGRRCLDA